MNKTKSLHIGVEVLSYKLKYNLVLGVCFFSSYMTLTKSASTFILLVLCDYHAAKGCLQVRKPFSLIHDFACISWELFLKKQYVKNRLSWLTILWVCATEQRKPSMMFPNISILIFSSRVCKLFPVLQGCPWTSCFSSGVCSTHWS